MMRAVLWRPVILIAILLFITNIVYEIFLSYLNTPDLVDAYYGICGTLLPFAFFYFYKNYGLKENPKAEMEPIKQ